MEDVQAEDGELATQDLSTGESGHLGEHIRATGLVERIHFAGEDVAGRESAFFAVQREYEVVARTCRASKEDWHVQGVRGWLCGRRVG